METQGLQVKSLLLQFFDEDRSQRPEFELGFAALRRREIVRFCQEVKFPIDHTMPHEQMVQIMNAALIEGKFDKFVARKRDSTEAEIIDLKRQVADLKEMIAANVKEAPTPAAAPPLELQAEPPSQPEAPAPEPVVIDPLEEEAKKRGYPQGYNHLKKLAVKHGLKPFFLKRGQIIQLLIDNGVYVSAGD